MKAVRVLEPGGPEKLLLLDVERPEPGAGEIAIDIHASSLNRADLLQRRGSYPPPPGVTDILGMECAGEVAALGPGCVGTHELGARVMALLGGGGYAERVVVPEAMAMKIPDALGFEQAAAIPEAFLTAREALVVAGRTQPSESVLIHAAAGGVGSAAVQLARELGAHVFATAGSAEKCAFVRKLGADRVIDYKSEDFAAVIAGETDGRGVDVILDFVGAAYAEKHAACLAPLGRHVMIGVLSGAKSSLNLGRLLAKRQTITGFTMRSRSNSEKIELTRAFVRTTLPLFESGRLKPLVDSVFSLSDVRKAHERMEANENLGKIVLRVRPPS
ncbi:MAG TPA: NAD(P)H-quinone oxidoreductase [Polyangiaceae bacterium]|jgi:putative PIG3 family NAD(P)H quinone oxidoreductase|nr:NAD(P)H-quinone oxidoreductase [Polyangiaceae bacterium]